MAKGEWLDSDDLAKAYAGKSKQLESVLKNCEKTWDNIRECQLYRNMSYKTENNNTLKHSQVTGREIKTKEERKREKRAAEHRETKAKRSKTDEGESEEGTTLKPLQEKDKRYLEQQKEKLTIELYTLNGHRKKLKSRALRTSSPQIRFAS